MDPKLKKWLRWMEIIKGEVQELLIAKRTHHEVGQIVYSNPALPKASSFYNHLGKTYTSHAVMGLRRQLKTGNRQISMASLFSDMLTSPHIITREYFVSLYTGSGVELLADGDFNKFAAPGAPHIDPSLVEADLRRIKDETRRCEDFADKRVAHRDNTAPRQFPTYAELDQGIDLLDQLYIKYHRLFHAQSMDTLMPARQYDWTEVFRIPWIAPF